MKTTELYFFTKETFKKAIEEKGLKSEEVSYHNGTTLGAYGIDEDFNLTGEKFLLVSFEEFKEVPNHEKGE